MPPLLDQVRVRLEAAYGSCHADTGTFLKKVWMQES
jgi:hypothetical protein